MGEAEEYFRKGLEYHRVSAFREAREMYERALKAKPNQEKVRVLLGNVAYHLGSLDESIEHYHRAIELDPRYTTAYFNLGVVLEEKRDFDAAIENYKKAIELNPNYAEAYSNLGSLLRDKGDIEDAIRCFQRAIELDKELSVPREEMEKILSEVQEQVTVRAVVKLAEGYLKDGEALEAEGRREEAIANYEKALQLYPNFLVGHFLMGLALEKKGDADKASRSYEKIFSLDAKLAAKDVSQEIVEVIGRRLGKLRFTSADFMAVLEKFHFSEMKKEKISFLEYFNREMLGKPEDFLKRGTELEAGGKLDEAIAWYRKAVGLAPFLPTPYYILGLALEKLGATEEAMENYRKAVELDIGFLTPKASQELSSMLSRQIGNVYVKNLDIAGLLKEFKSYVEERSGAPSLEEFIKHKITGEAEERLKEGFLLDIGGRVDEAISKYEKAIEVDPNNLVAYYILGLALESKGELDRAMEHYKKTDGLDLSKAPNVVSPEVIEIINKYMERTTKDGYKVGAILRRYIEIIGENPEKMLRLLSYIEDIKLDKIPQIIDSYLRGDLMVEGEGRIIRDKEDFIEDYEEEKLKQKKAKEISKEKVTLLWKYKTARTIRCCALSFNGEFIVGGAENGIIYFLNKKGEPLWKAAPNVNIIDIDISSEGKYVIDCLHSGVVELRDGENGNLLWSLDLKDSGVTSAALASNAEFAVIGTRDSQVILLDKNGKTIWKHRISGYCSKVDISMDGRYVAACSDEGGVYILRHRGAIPVVDTMKLKDTLYSIAISSDGSLIAAGSREGRVYLISGDRKILWKQETLSHVYGVAVSTKGKFVAAGTASGFVYFYDMSGGLLWKYPTGENMWDVDVSLEGTRVVAGCGLVFGNVYLFESR